MAASGVSEAASSTGVLPRATALARVVSREAGKRNTLTLFGLYVLTTLLEGVGLTLIVPVAESVRGDGTVTIPGLGRETTPTLAYLAILVAFVGRALLTRVSAIRGNELRLRTADSIRLAALEATLNARWEFVATQRQSHLVQGLTTEVQRASAAIDLLFRASISALLLMVTAGAALLVAPAVAGVTIVLIASLALLIRRDVTRSITLGADVSRSITRFGAIVTDSLSSIRLVRSHDAADRWLATLEDEASVGRETTLQVVRRAARTQLILSIAGVSGLIGMVLVALWTGVDTPRLVALVVISSRLLAASRSLITQAQQFAHLSPALEHLQEHLTAAQTAREVPRAARVLPRGPRGCSPELELRDLTVRYDAGGAPAVEGLSALVPAGVITLLQGPSGAGKSTLLDVILGLVQPEHGVVLVDGEPVSSVQDWRSRLGFVPQDTVLIPGSVRENLDWSATNGPPPTDDDLWQALAVAQLEDVVRQLPGRLDATLHELAQLSGGERQRLCLARALVRRPDVLVLDEATSGLDPRTESSLLDALAKTGATVLLATHREALEARAARVIRLRGSAPDADPAVVWRTRLT